MQGPPHLLHTVEAAFDLAVSRCMPRAGHSHTGRTPRALVAECCLLLWEAPHTDKTANPTTHLPSPAPAPSTGPTTPAAAQYRGCIWPCSAPWHAQGWPLTHWQGSVRCGCRVLPPPLEISLNRQNRNPLKPPAQQPCRSPQCRPHHTCCIQQRLHLTLQCP